MKKSKIIALLLSLCFAFPFVGLHSQSVSFPDDAKNRGYYNRPYKRYEAETGKCNTDGTILQRSFNQNDVQSEASNQVATQLINQNSYIEWTNDEAANGMVIRFSLPTDANRQTGVQGNVALYVNDVKKADVTLNSYWAWQFFSGDQNVAFNSPTGTNIIRMRFDETRILLDENIPAGAKFKLVKTDNNTTPYTIDFVELEPVAPATTFASITDADKVEYTGNGSDLRTFIQNNGGKTIYIPAGKYDVPNKINSISNNTKIIGAGMWYTQLHFTANSPSGSKGIETNSSNILIDGLYITTQSNVRYYNRNEGQSAGKGLEGCFGVNSTIKNVWVMHFDNGAWIANFTSSTVVANNLHVINCRFRNNYADGINLAKGTKNSIVEHCSFRNNGDDDMASWSSDNQMCENNTFRYNTSENNWRAAAIGFFGGKQNKAHHCVIIDPVESGLRVDATFVPSAPFSADGYSVFSDISVYHGGTNRNVWKNDNRGAIDISLGGAKYNITNISFKNIDLINSKQHAIAFYTYENNTFTADVCFENINIDGTGVMSNSGNGIWVERRIKGRALYKNVTFSNITGQEIVNSSTNFTLSETTESCGGESPVKITDVEDAQQIKLSSGKNFIKMSNLPSGEMLEVYNITGSKIFQSKIKQEEETVSSLHSGLYIVSVNNFREKIFVNP